MFDSSAVSTSSTPAPTKQELRRDMRARLRAMTTSERETWSAAIVAHLQGATGWGEAGRTVAMFGGMASEPDVLPLLPWLAARGVRVAFFAIEGHVMVPFAVRGGQDLRQGPMGVLEPVRAEARQLAVAELSTVLLPGLAFSAKEGLRLGRGKGHYDRALAEANPQCRCIGVCFHAQLLPALPGEAHDVRVQAIVTERGWQPIGE